jgi:ribosomal protein L29
MKKEDKNSKLAEIATIKKELMMLRIKASSGDAVLVKEFKNKKKAIARIFTEVNAVNNKKTKKA